MIKLVVDENEIFSKIQTDDLQFLKIKSLLKNYGCKYDFCKFYLVENNKQYSVISVLDSCCIVYNNCDENLNEIIQFIILNTNISNVSLICNDGIELNKNVLKTFDLVSGNIMKNKNLETDFASQNQFSNSINLENCFNILSLGFSVLNQDIFPNWFCDISHRVRNNEAEVYGVKDIVTAILLYKNQHSGIISQVCVNPKYQKMGYGKDIINYILNKHKDKLFYVYSKDEATDEFYKKLKFDYYGKWLELKRKRIV